MTTVTERYIAAWRAHDLPAILAVLTPDCTVIESFGPVYRGVDRVAEWVRRWVADGARVLNWQVHSATSCGDREWTEWTFTYDWGEGRTSFDGASVAAIYDGRIAHLREYATTAELYDWTGEWRTKG